MKYASLTNETQLQVSFQFHQVSSCLSKSELSIPKEFELTPICMKLLPQQIQFLHFTFQIYCIQPDRIRNNSCKNQYSYDVSCFFLCIKLFQRTGFLLKKKKKETERNSPHIHCWFFYFSVNKEFDWLSAEVCLVFLKSTNL